MEIMDFEVSLKKLRMDDSRRWEKAQVWLDLGYENYVHVMKERN